jgi:putative inorganic carbon (HCO3(-)) transporter
MIDWIGVGKSAPLVMGLALVVASLSWASWLAVRRGTRLRAAVATSGVQACLNLGLTLVSAGLFLSARSALEHLLWCAFLFWFVAQAFSALRSRRSIIAMTVKRSTVDRPRIWDTSFTLLKTTARWVVRMEPWLLLAVMPFLMFPNRFTPALIPLLSLPWLARKFTQGRFTARTPMDWPILILLLMLPVSLWASTDVQQSMPKLYGIILGMAVFYGIVNHVQQSGQGWIVSMGIALAGMAVSALALVGTDWPGEAFALPQACRYLTRLITQMAGSALGFHPNEVGATLSLFIPLVTSLLFSGFSRSQQTAPAHSSSADCGPIPWHVRHWVLFSLLALDLLVMSGMLILTESRSAWLGIGIALLVLASFRRRWLGPSVVLLVGALAQYYLGAEQILNSILAVGAERNVRARFEIWQRALYMVQDFAYTGVGLNTFSLAANVLYPFFSIPPERVLQLTHAHNAFLQVAVDVGVPGLVAYLALLLGFGVAWWTAYSHFASGPLRDLSVGLLCSMVAYHVYGLTDCITLGAKPGVAIWAVLGLMAALANLSSAGQGRVDNGDRNEDSHRYAYTYPGGDPGEDTDEGSQIDEQTAIQPCSGFNRLQRFLVL